MKKKKSIQFAVKRGQLSLFGGAPEFMPMTRKQKRIMKLIGEIRVEKLQLKRCMEDATLEHWLTENDLLDRYLHNRRAIHLKLKKLSYDYTEGEENHSRYDVYLKKIKKPAAAKIVFGDNEAPF